MIIFLRYSDMLLQVVHLHHLKQPVYSLDQEMYGAGGPHCSDSIVSNRSTWIVKCIKELINLFRMELWHLSEVGSEAVYEQVIYYSLSVMPAQGLVVLDVNLIISYDGYTIEEIHYLFDIILWLREVQIIKLLKRLLFFNDHILSSLSLSLRSNIITCHHS